MESNQLENKIDKISDDIRKIEVHIGEIKVDVGHHIKRTDLLEAQMQPLRDHLIMLKGVMNLVKLASLVAVIVEAIRLFR